MLQLLLLTKAVLVALYGSDGLLPAAHGRHAGLLLLFAPILSSACLMAGQHLALGAYISGARWARLLCMSEIAAVCGAPD